MRTPNWPQPFTKFLNIGHILNQLLRWPIPAQMFEEFTSFTDCPLFCSPYISLLAHITFTSNLKNIGFYSEWPRQKLCLISVWWGAEQAKPSAWVPFICRPCHPGKGSPILLWDGEGWAASSWKATVYFGCVTPFLWLCGTELRLWRREYSKTVPLSFHTQRTLDLLGRGW